MMMKLNIHSWLQGHLNTKRWEKLYHQQIQQLLLDIQKKLPKRNTVHMKCRDHCPMTRGSKKTDIWTDLNSQCSSYIKYEIREEFRSGILPRQK